MLKFQAIISLVGLLSRTDRYEEAARLLLASHDLVPSAEQAQKELRYLEVLSVLALLALLVQKYKSTNTESSAVSRLSVRTCSPKLPRSRRRATRLRCARARVGTWRNTCQVSSMCVSICTFVLGKEQASRNAAAVRASARRLVARHMSGYSSVSIATD